MKLSLIAARTANNVIGKDNGIPWRLPTDLKRFKNLTMGKVVIMGRRTFHSIGSKPLPNRTNIIVSKSPEFADMFVYGQPALMSVTSLDSALHLAIQVAHGKRTLTGNQEMDEVFVIGGKSLYEDCFPMARKLYLTTIHAECAGDVLFPTFNEQEWDATFSEELTDENSFLLSDQTKKPLSYKFEILERKAR